VKDSGSSMSDNSQSPAPAKPPRTFDSEVENVEPAVTQAARSTFDGSSSTKRHAPLPPTSVSAKELSPLHTSTPIRSVPSPIKMIKVDENIDSPDIVTNGDKIGDVETTSVAEGEHQNSQTDKPAEKLEERRGTTATGHVSSATLIFGGTPGQKSGTPAKVAIIQKTVPSGSQPQQGLVSKASDDDSVVDEPTKQPVAARLAAWETKQVTTTTQEPLAVSSRVKNYEKKITTDEKARGTPAKPRSNTEAGAANKMTSIATTKKSPIKPGAAKVASSPAKSVLSSPQKLSPATRAIQERLTQICEAGTKNEAVDRERKERAAELAEVGNRWQQGSFATAESEVSCLLLN